MRPSFETNLKLGSKGFVTKEVTAEMGCKFAELDLPIVVKYIKYPFDPGKITGPPEECYPAEGGEIEIVYAAIKNNHTNAEFHLPYLEDAIQQSVDCGGYWLDVIEEKHRIECEAKAEAEAEAYMESIVS